MVLLPADSNAASNTLRRRILMARSTAYPLPMPPGSNSDSSSEEANRALLWIQSNLFPSDIRSRGGQLVRSRQRSGSAKKLPDLHQFADRNIEGAVRSFAPCQTSCKKWNVSGSVVTSSSKAWRLIRESSLSGR